MPKAPSHPSNIKNKIEWVNKLEAWSHLKFWKYYYSDVLPKVDKPDTIPDRSLWFKALELCPPDRVRLVILTGNPYPRKEHNHGIALSVPASVEPLPAPLRIFLESLADSNGGVRPRNGDLRAICERGLLLLNTSLTCTPGQPSNHSDVGWSRLIFELLRDLSGTRDGIVFVFLGKEAEDFSAAVDDIKHCVICAPHPSPLAAIGAGDFSSARVFDRIFEYNPELRGTFWKT